MKNFIQEDKFLTLKKIEEENSLQIKAQKSIVHNLNNYIDKIKNNLNNIYCEICKKNNPNLSIYFCNNHYFHIAHETCANNNDEINKQDKMILCEPSKKVFITVSMNLFLKNFLKENERIVYIDLNNYITNFITDINKKKIEFIVNYNNELNNLSKKVNDFVVNYEKKIIQQ